LTTWHCILSAELTKTYFFRRFLAILPTGIVPTNRVRVNTLT